MTGRFDAQAGIDAALGAKPAQAAAWAVLAPIVYPIVFLVLTNAVLPDFTETAKPGDFWLLSCVVFGAMFAHVSFWSDAAARAPFAGRLVLNTETLLLALLIGPLVMPLIRVVLGGVGLDSAEDFLVDPEGSEWLFKEGAAGLAMIGAVVVFGPLAEEVVYRGVALGALLGRAVPPTIAVAGTAAVFAGQHTHLTLAGMLPIFVFGLFLGWLRLRSGGVAAPILAHMAANGSAIAPLAFGA